ncbi:MAG TPA: TlpA disulfide reductase family protein [Candidatus Angelobacter sp.]|nr:TlpA disulfide reductase family protein [Candidatus Angelobacter sp.]
MDTIAIKESHEPLRPGLSFKAILGLIALAALTILLTWRARIIERALQGEREEPALVGKTAPDFSASTLDGRTVSLAEFRGQKKVVVSFWASWCGPCRLEMPGLIKFYKDHHDASSDFEILAVSIDEDTRDAADFATAQKLTFPVLLDPRQKIADAYQVEGIPTMFIIDKDGKIISGQIGYDMTMEFRLAGMLGIKEKKAREGASDGGASD